MNQPTTTLRNTIREFLDTEINTDLQTKIRFFMLNILDIKDVPSVLDGYLYTVIDTTTDVNIEELYNRYKQMAGTGPLSPFSAYHLEEFRRYVTTFINKRRQNNLM